MNRVGALLFALVGWLAAAELPAKREVRYGSLSPQIQRELERKGITRDGFDRFRQSLDRETAERVRIGENDHLVYFVLQSAAFTSKPRIEPALSALELARSEKIPVAVSRRIDDFLRALDRPAADERLRYFQQAPHLTRDALAAEYTRAMRFLYEKEFVARGKPDQVSALYQKRGHSTDTRMEANFAVWTALSVLKEMAPSWRPAKVLVVGPGLDFAPRTALYDRVPPQSYQPFALADALVSLELAARDRLRIHCVDINERVVRFLESPPSRLIVLAESGVDEYARYFRQVGAAIGKTAAVEGGKSIEVDRAVAGRITAAKLNILTERYDPSPEYDLVVVTNVLVYFNRTELLLALANIHAMMKPGGYLIHNELRPEMDGISRAAGLTPVQARTLRITSDLYDGFAIYRRGGF